MKYISCSSANENEKYHLTIIYYKIGSELGRVRYDCFIFEGGLKKPMAITPKVKDNTEENNAEVVEQTTPVSDYTVDDSAALEAIFRGEDNE